MPDAKKPRLQNEWLRFIIFVSSLFSKRSASKFTATSSIPIAKPPNKSEIKKKIGEKDSALKTSAKPSIGIPKHIVFLNPILSSIKSANNKDI